MVTLFFVFWLGSLWLPFSQCFRLLTSFFFVDMCEVQHRCNFDVLSREVVVLGTVKPYSLQISIFSPNFSNELSQTTTAQTLPHSNPSAQTGQNSTPPDQTNTSRKGRNNNPSHPVSSQHLKRAPFSVNKKINGYPRQRTT